MERTLFYRALAFFLLGRKRPGHAIIVGINGPDGCGKTRMAEGFGAYLQQAGYPVCTVSVDNFHHPRPYRYRRGQDSPAAYYHDSINYEAFANKALQPVFEAKSYPVRCQTKLFDLARDREDILFQEVNENTVLLAEGVFLFRPEIRPWLHAKIFLRADLETILKRVRVRDRQTLGSAAKILERYEKKYLPGQKLYFHEIQPETFADVIVDNNDFESPEIVLTRSPVSVWPSRRT